MDEPVGSLTVSSKEPDSSGSSGSTGNSPDNLPIGPGARLCWYHYLSLGVLAFSASIAHNFLAPVTRVTFLFDGWHYLATTQALYRFIIELPNNGYSMAPLFEPTLEGGLLLDGPALAGLFSTLFAIIGHEPAAMDWWIFVAVMCFVHALSSMLVLAIAARTVRSRWAALAGGVIWALYPGALFATCRYMTEPLAAFALLALVLAVLLTHKSARYAAFAGVAAAGALLLKSPMIPAIAVLLLFLCAVSRKKALAAFLVVSTASMILLPWVAFTWNATGKPSLTISRVPVFNATVGCDLENNGWQTMSTTPLQAIFDEKRDSWWAVTASAWISNPLPMFRLTLSKLTRFLSVPYNDSRHAIFGISYSRQAILHYLFLFLAFFGMFAWWHRISRYSLVENALFDSYPLLLSAILVAGHSIYYLFEAIPRVVFFVLPFYAIFAAFAFDTIFASIHKRQWRVLAIALPAALSVWLVLNAEPLFGLDGPKESANSFSRGAIVERVFDLSGRESDKEPDTAYILIDGDKRIDSARIHLNDNFIDGPIMPIWQFNPILFGNYDLARKVAYLLDLDTSDFRQWRAIRVEKEFIAGGGRNSIRVELPSGGIIYGTPHEERRFPSLDAISFQKLTASCDSLEMRTISPVIKAGLSARCRVIEQKLVRDLPCDLRIYLVCAGGKKGVATRLLQTGEVLSEKLDTDQFDMMMRSSEAGDLRINRHVLRYARSTGASLEIPPSISCATHLRARFDADVKRLNGADDSNPESGIGIYLAARGANGNSLPFALIPERIPVTRQWMPLSIEDLVPLRSIDYRPKYLDIAFFPGSCQRIALAGTDRTCSDFLLRNGRITFQSVNLGELPVKNVRIY